MFSPSRNVPKTGKSAYRSNRSCSDVEDVTDSTLSLEDSERELIRKALERNGNNRRKTAGELKISERTLYRKIKEYGLENPEL